MCPKEAKKGWQPVASALKLVTRQRGCSRCHALCLSPTYLPRDPENSCESRSNLIGAPAYAGLLYASQHIRILLYHKYACPWCVRVQRYVTQINSFVYAVRHALVLLSVASHVDYIITQ